MNLYLGPALGSMLYSFGGFTLPFLVVASVALVNSIALAIVLPNIEISKKQENETTSIRLTFSALIKVWFHFNDLNFT